MIINDRKDLDAAPDDVRDRFLASLAGSINKYAWDGTEWVPEQNTAEIERFGFTLEDFPDAPTPDKPTYNPDERALEQEADEVRTQRNALLVESDWTVLPDAPRCRCSGLEGLPSGTERRATAERIPDRH